MAPVTSTPATAITTGLSVSSIATDKRVKAGGTYFIISRSLGLPIGGTLGILVGLSGYLVPVVRNVEELLPDHDVDLAALQAQKTAQDDEAALAAESMV